MCFIPIADLVLNGFGWVFDLADCETQFVHINFLIELALALMFNVCCPREPCDATPTTIAS